jgi:hypothetical protein
MDDERQGLGMGFFDFLGQNSFYAAEPSSVVRLNLRHRMIVEPLLPLFKGRSVLDIGARDGRWAYAFATAGSTMVTALEEHSDLVRRFEDLPDDEAKSRITLKCTNIFKGLEQELALGKTHEIITIMGYFHYLFDQFRLLFLLGQLRPKVIIVDSEFALNNDPVIALFEGDKIEDMDAVSNFSHDRPPLVGIPSREALKAMGQSVGYQCDWINWDRLGPDDRPHIREYFKRDRSRRFTCLMHAI